MNIATLLREQAGRRPDAVAIIDRCKGRDRLKTYADLAGDAARVAALLQGKGVGKGDRVLVFQAMSYELYTVLLAIFQLGAVAMFLDPSAGRRHIEQCCEIGVPRGLVASGRAHLLRLFSASLRRIPIKCLASGRLPGTLSLVEAMGYDPLPASVDCTADDPALLTFTSGSTGQPKAALRCHGFLLAQHRALETALELEPGQVDLATLPIFLLANLASGLTSVIPAADLRYPGRIDAAPVIEQMERHGVVRSAGSPALYRQIITQCRRQGRGLGRLQRIDTGGAPVFPPLLERLGQIAPQAKVVAVYGSTEAEPMAHVAWQDMTKADLQAMAAGRGLLAGPPVPEVELRILPDRFGQPIGPFTRGAFDADTRPRGEIGEIVVCGDHVLKGYLHGQGDGETKFAVDGVRWHRTGDAGYLDPVGRLWLVGRCGGRVQDRQGVLYPFCVECAAQFHPGVRRAAILSHQGRRILMVEADGPLQSAELLGALAWACLDAVRLVDAIPVDKRHNAKVDYTRLHGLLDKRRGPGRCLGRFR